MYGGRRPEKKCSAPRETARRIASVPTFVRSRCRRSRSRTRRRASIARRCSGGSARTRSMRWSKRRRAVVMPCGMSERSCSTTAPSPRASARCPHSSAGRRRAFGWVTSPERGASSKPCSPATTPRTTRDRAEEALADALFREGRFVDASDQYRKLAMRVLDEDFGRTLEVKAILAGDPRARGTLEALLIGLPGRPADTTLGLVRARAWQAESGDPLADYLLARSKPPRQR